MPEIPFEVLKISAAAGGQYGIVQGKIKGEVAAHIELSADLCHGVQLGVEGQIAGLVEGQAAALFIGARLRGEAAAEAGAKVLIRLEPNLFDQLGLSVDAGAYARAHVAGSIAVYLTPEYFAAFANAHFDDFSADLFLIFLEEVYAEVGVWGKAAFAAMIDAHLNVIIDVKDLAAGFEISAGYNYGLEVGCGWDYYCSAGFRDLRRAVLRSSLRISQEARRHILGATLPRGPLLALGFDFTFPLITLIAFDLGRASHLKKALLSTQEVMDIVLDDFLQNLQRFAIERLVEGAVGRLSAGFSDLYYRASGIDLSEDEVDQLEREVQALIDVLRKGRVEQSDLGEIIGRSVAIVDLIDGGLFDPLKPPLTLVWTASMLGLQIKAELDAFYADIGISNSLLGGIRTSAVAPVLPAAPQFVKDEVRRVLGPDVLEIDVAAAVDYLIAEGAEDLILEHGPEFAQFRKSFQATFDLSEGDLVQDLLRIWRGEGNLQGLRSYEAFKGFVRLELIQGMLIDELLPQLESRVTNETFAEYLREVVEPSLRVVSEFLFSRLDGLLLDDVTNPMPAENRLRLIEGVSTGCGVVVYNVIARNIVFFDQMVTDYVLETMHGQFAGMRAWLDDTGHPFFHSCALVAKQSLPGKPDVDAHAEAFRELLYDVVTTLERLTGPVIYTYERRQELHRLKKDILLGIGGSRQFRDGPAIESALLEMVECNIPGVQLAKVERLVGLMYAIGVDSIQVIAEYLLPSLGDFFLKLTLGEFNALRSSLLEYVSELRDAFLDALDQYDAASDVFKEEIIDRLDALQQQLDGLLAGIQAHIDSDWELALKVRIRIIGEQQIRDQNLGSGEQAALLAFQTAAWLLIEPAIDATAVSIRAEFQDFSQTLDRFVDASEGAAAAFLAFQESIETLALNGLAGLAVSAADCAAATIETLFPAYIVGQIEAYLDSRAEQKQLQQERYQREQELAALLNDKQAARDRYDAVAHRSHLDVSVVSPLPAFRFVYPASLEFTMLLRGFTQEMLTGRGNRLQLMLNGAPLPVTAPDIVYSAKLDTYLFRKVFPPGFLQDGLNVLEVSWIHGESSSEIRRRTVQFIVDASSYYPAEDIAIGFHANPPGDDVRGEYVQFEWNGDDALDMGGWLVRDRAKHRYQLPALSLSGGQRVRIYTGGQAVDDVTTAAEPDKRVHMGRRKAVWNNEGDTLYLIKDEVVLVYSATYLGLD